MSVSRSAAPGPFAARCLALILLLALAGCATGPQRVGLTDGAPPDIPRRVELDEVPFFAQERYQCGPAALAMVLQQAGRDVKPSALVSEVYVPEKRGSLRPEMRAAARGRGAVPYPVEPRLETLLRELAAGRPVLVMQNLGLEWWPRWHYAVAVGYDLDEGDLLLRSGRDRVRRTDLDTFDRTWARADRWGQVVVAPGDPPATAEPLDWLKTVRELEQVGERDAAFAGYRAATERWPEHRPGWMARGNAAHARGEHGDARRAFMRAVKLDPDASDGWNNLAYAMAETGCGSAALDAARCAVRVAEPGDDNAEDTLDELSSGSLPQALGADCGIPACPAGD